MSPDHAVSKFSFSLYLCLDCDIPGCWNNSSVFKLHHFPVILQQEFRITYRKHFLFFFFNGEEILIIIKLHSPVDPRRSPEWKLRHDTPKIHELTILEWEQSAWENQRKLCLNNHVFFPMTAKWSDRGQSFEGFFIRVFMMRVSWNYINKLKSQLFLCVVAFTWFGSLVIFLVKIFSSGCSGSWRQILSYFVDITAKLHRPKNYHDRTEIVLKPETQTDIERYALTDSAEINT